MGQSDEDGGGSGSGQDGMIGCHDHNCEERTRLESTNVVQSNGNSSSTSNNTSSTSNNTSSGCSSSLSSTNSSQVTSPMQEDAIISAASGGGGNHCEGMDGSSGRGSCTRSISGEDNCLAMIMSSSNSCAVSENVGKVSTSTTIASITRVNDQDNDDDDNQEDLRGEVVSSRDTTGFKKDSHVAPIISPTRKQPYQKNKKKGFSIAGLSLSGLSKVFQSSSSSSSSNSNEQHQHHHHHHHRSSSQPGGSSTENLVLMNNQKMSPSTATIMMISSVSKSSSESNIPMCHNSLDNLIDDDLPSSRSTDSSCLLTNPEDSIDLQIRTRSIMGLRNPDTVSNGQFDSLVSDHHSAGGQRGDEEDEEEQDEDEELNNNNNNGQSGSSINNNNNNNASEGKTEASTSSNASSSSTSSGTQLLGPKFKLISEGDVQVCKVKHGQNLMSKLTSSKLLRRWETHHLYLNDSCISSKTPIGCLSNPIAYWQMEEVYVVVRWDSGRRYVIRIVLPDGSLLLQGSNAYVRDQWYHSIIWKKNIFKYHNLMRSSKRPEVIMKELKSLVDFATITPLQDDCISHVPIEIVSSLLDSAGDLLGKTQAEEVLVALAPLLERSHPPPSLCRFFSRHCRARPRCPLVNQLFTPVVRRALKHNVDFGKYPYMRRFIQDYIQALNCHNDGINVVRNFVKSMHGPASSCPHPRVMSNLVSVCLAAIFAIFERNNAKRASNLHSETIKEIPWDEQLLCYMAVFDTISEFEDWRPSLAQLLQPIPFPDDALTNPLFTRSLSSVIRRIGSDNRCDVHQMVMGIRDGKEGWFHLYSTSNLACSDDGELWGLMLGRLLSCCCRRKRFLMELGGKLLGSSLLLALREHAAAQEALCLLLEWQIVQSDDQRVQIATTLQSTPTGSAHYAALCSRQLHLKELQQKGGPRKLTLPSRATDADLAKLLSCGSFGNLECLSLAFTQVTSACAEQLIKLPSLRYLNLWSTQFGDPGLNLISEHLPNLQVLNLCETPVTDKGLLSLTSMTSLRKLNLNSTHLSAQTFASLKEKLPALKEVDVRYTDAW